MSYYEYNYNPLMTMNRRKTRYAPWAWAPIAILILLVLNILFLKRLTTQSSPLDDFQEMNTVHPVIKNATGGPITSTMSERAVVSTLYTESYVPGALTLGHSLRAVQTNSRSILLYFPERISPESCCRLRAVGWELHPISRVDPPNGGKGVRDHFFDTYSKLQMWGLDAIGIKEVIFLDGDTIVKENFDELWSLPFSFAAVPDIYEDKRGFTISFNTGVMFLHTSSALLDDMLSHIRTAGYAHIDGDQGFLNTYFPAQAVRLPYIYNANLAIKNRSPKLWESMKKDMKIVHYTLVKPWEVIDLQHGAPRDDTSSGHWREELQWWGEGWNSTMIALSYIDCSAS